MIFGKFQFLKYFICKQPKRTFGWIALAILAPICLSPILIGQALPSHQIYSSRLLHIVSYEYFNSHNSMIGEPSTHMMAIKSFPTNENNVFLLLFVLKVHDM